MAQWLQLTEHPSQRDVYVNMDQAIYIGENTGTTGTRIVFERGDKPQILAVVEAPEQVFAQLSNTPRA